MKRLLLLFPLLFLAVSCDNDDKIEPVHLDVSDIAGKWVIVSVKTHHEKTDSFIEWFPQGMFRDSYFAFFGNGRFETEYIYGEVTEGSWSYNDSEISVAVGADHWESFMPLSFDGNTLQFVSESQYYYTCTKQHLNEFSPGYGSEDPASFLDSQKNVDAFLSGITSEKQIFEAAVASLAKTWIDTSHWEDLSEIEELWRSSVAVLNRCNQLIDFLERKSLFPQALEKAKLLRAWAAYCRLVCWGDCATYWQHAGLEMMQPRPMSPEMIISFAQQDLAGNNSPEALALSSQISSLASELKAVPYSRPVEKWGIKLPPNDMGIFFLPVPICILFFNYNQPQTAGW